MSLLFSNPIVKRELIGMLRTRRALLVMLSLPLLLSLLVLVRWPTEGRVDLNAGSSQQVFRVFGYGLMAGLILLAPVFSATTVVRERAQGTLALLLNSPLGAPALVFGKLLGTAGYVLLLLVLSMPAAAACYAMGGIGLGSQLGMAYLVLTVLALEYATLGLLVSTRVATTDGALRTTYGLILLLAVISLGPYQFVRGSATLDAMTGGWALPISEWLRCLSPIPAMAEVLGDTAATGGGVQAAGGVALRFIVLGMVLTLVFSVVAGIRLSQRMLDRSRASGKITDERSGAVRFYRRIMYLWFFDPQRRSGLIGRWTNPIAVKERRTSRFGRSHWMMRMLGACLIVSLGLMLLAAMQAQAAGVETLGGVMVLLQVSLIILMTPSMASGLISAERESRSWQLLQMTPLSSMTIVLGKLQSVASTLVLLLLATLPGYGVLIAIDEHQRPVVLQVLASLCLTAVMALMVSAAMSSLFRTTAAATAASYTLLVTLCAGTLLLWLGEGAPFGRDLVEKALMFNPLAASLSLIRAPGFADYQLLPGAWWVMGGFSLLGLLVLLVQVWRLSRPK